MIGTLVNLATLPLRLALRGAETVIRVVAGDGDGPDTRYSATATSPAVRPREPVQWDEEAGPGEPAPREAATRPARAPRKPPAADPVPAEPVAAEPVSPPAAVEEPEVPDHVSEEAVLVEEFADPGAEDGAGAEVSVMEPWPAYGTMKANEVIARLEQAGAAEVAVARLYEQSSRGRKTVLAAADRRLKLLDA